MQLKPDRLHDELGAGELRSCYLVAGDEPLQVQEAADAVRAAALRAGVDERVVLHVETGFDWRRLAGERDALSLFASRRLIDLRLPSGKPGKDGAAALVEYAEAADDAADVLLLTTGKLDKRAQQTRWVQALAAAGALVLCYPVGLSALPGWLQRRARARGVELTADAAALVAERSEGNMLAADQELTKLELAGAGETLDAERARALITDSSRHDIFELADAAFAGDAPRALRILRGLRAEGVEVPAVAWVLGREIRLLTGLMAAMSAGASESDALRSARVWDRRVPMVRGAMRRHRRTGLVRLNRLAGRLERTSKGMTGGDSWQECTWLVLGIAGHRLPAIEAALLG